MVTVETTRFYSSHSKLIDTLKKLGYPASDGLCHGVACVAAQYHLSDDMKTFHQYIKFTEKNSRFSDKQPHHTRRFFDDIIIGQSPNDYPLIKNIAPIFKNNKTQNSITALAAIKNSNIKKYQGITCRAHFTGAYSMLELRRYFDLLSESATLHACTFALLVGSPLHAIMIGFDAKKNQWVFVDANKLPQRNFEYYNSARLAIETNCALSSSRCGNTIFSTQLLTKQNCDINANHFVAHLYRDERWKKLHAVSIQKSTMSDSFNNTWLMSACTIESEIGIVKSLLKQKVGIEHTNELNFSALTYAISYGNKAIVNLLLNNGANADHPENDYLELATQCGFYDIAKDLLLHGAKIHPNHRSPIFTAASQGDQRFIKLFKQYGYTGAGSSFDRFFSHIRRDMRPVLTNQKNQGDNKMGF